MKKRTNMILTIIFLVWLVFLMDWNFTYTNAKYSYSFEYTGLLWVGLDYYTIIRYKSNDKPKQWVEYKRIKV